MMTVDEALQCAEIHAENKRHGLAISDAATASIALATEVRILRDELEQERKRLDWALEHGCVFRPPSDRFHWHYAEKIGYSIEKTTNPRATIDELIAGENK